jgi:hypothetical protein
MAATGYALTVGLNSVDPHHYQGWSGDLNACEADAKDLAALLTARNFQVNTLLTKAATREAVLNGIKKMAGVAKAGDLVVFTNSSHGGQLPDLNDDEDEGYDETICMYDGEIVDDELYAALAKFASGVRILMLSDSCHSGTVTRMARTQEVIVSPPAEGRVPRAMPAPIAARTYQANHAMYDRILKNPELKAARAEIAASVLLISGCMDNQTSLDGTFNGLFTGTLLKVWNGGKFKGSYKKFWKKILSSMPSDQTPNFFWAMQRDAAFERQAPFKI